MHVEEKIREGALEARSQAFVNGETRASNFRGGSEVENAGAFADFPMRFRLKIKFRGRAPAANFDILCRGVPNGHASVRQIRNLEQEIYLSLRQFDGVEALDL